MLSNDISKKIMIRFKKSKDFEKTAEKLRKEGYKVLKNYDSLCNNGKAQQVSILRVFKDNNQLVSVYYEDNHDIDSEYKQNIHLIIY